MGLKLLGNKEQVQYRKILRETYKKFIVENKNNIKYDIEKLITEMEADLYASYFTNKNIAKNALKEVIEYLKEYKYDDEKQHTVTTLSHLYNRINNQTTSHDYDKYIYKQAIYDAEIRMKALDLKIKPEIIKSLVWGDNDEM